MSLWVWGWAQVAFAHDHHSYGLRGAPGLLAETWDRTWCAVKAVIAAEKYRMENTPCCSL